MLPLPVSCPTGIAGSLPTGLGTASSPAIRCRRLTRGSRISVLPGTFAVNAGADASRCALTRRATSLSRSSKLEGTLFTFADGGENDGLPEFYPSGNKTASVAATVVCDQLQHDALMSVVRSQPVCWIRDPLGNRERVHLSISDDVSAGYPPVHSVGLEGDVLVFREANNG